MSDFMKRATMGLLFTFCAWGLIHINHEVWACLPAASAVYLLGVTLFDALIKNY